VEPFFAVDFTRDQADHIMHETNPAFEVIAKARGFWSEALLEKISADGGSVAHCDEVPADVKSAFRVSHDISPEYHIKMQAAFQRHLDNAVSKTVNFPKEATKEDVEKVFLLAFEMKTKGVTIYRDGSRDEQVLSTGKTTEQKAVVVPEADNRRHKRERPKALKGMTYCMGTGCGDLYVTINEDETGLFELFTTMGKAGGCAASQSEALGRMISLAWRNGIGEKQIIDQLRGISCHQPCGFGEGKVLSCADAVAKAVLTHMSAKTGSEEYAVKKVAQHTGACPDCGGTIAHESGCNLCHACGWSAC
jgi:ribonucleoside-diphosphate reductase alpha chain